MKQKNKNIGANCMAIDHQRRIRLPERIIKEFGAQKSEHIILTIDHHRSLVAFRYVSEIKEYAHDIVEKTSVSKSNAEFLLFSRKINVKIDSRSRISIPEDLLRDADLKDQVQIIDYGNRLELINPKRVKELQKDILKKITDSE